MRTECASGLTHTLMHLTEITVLFAKLLVKFCGMLRCIALISLLSLAFSLIPLMFKGTLHSVKKTLIQKAYCVYYYILKERRFFYVD